MELFELAIGLVVILVAAELFTNGIEWFGHKLNLAEGAVGSVLAAVGTALPETMIPLIAILLAGTRADPEAAHQVGVGAILGAPFMLSTLAMFVTGAGVLFWAKRRSTGAQMPVDTKVLGKDIRYFYLAYAIAVGAAFIPADFSFLRYGVVVIVVGIYAWYVKAHFEADTTIDAVDLAPLRFQRLDRRAYKRDPAGNPRLRVVNVQVLVALAMIIAGAFVFVDAVEHVSKSAGLDPALAGADHRAHRDRAAREVQQPDLGAPDQGHVGDGQHHRRNGLPVVHPDGHRHRPCRRRLDRLAGLAAQLRVGRHRLRLDRGDLPADDAARHTLGQAPADWRSVLRPLRTHSGGKTRRHHLATYTAARC